MIIPAESVYAAFESKQAINAEEVKYTSEKVASVRRLHRTSLPIPHAGGTYPAKPLIPIYGGLLTFESDWKPPLGESLNESLSVTKGDGRLNFGCVAAHGYITWNSKSGQCEIREEKRAATAFLFDLISQLQFSGTVPMIDVQAYAKWLAK